MDIPLEENLTLGSELREALVKNWIDGLKKIGFEPTKRDICFFKTGFNMCWSAERNSTKEE